MMNRLLTILLLLGATAHGQINNPPTSVNIVDATATGRAVLTATDAAAAATAVGLGAANNVTFSNITANGIVTANDSTATPATNAAAAQGIQWPGLGGSQHAAIYGGYAGAAQIALAVGTSNSLSDVATFSATGMTVNSNAIVGGTLGVTGNATFSGTANLAPSQTASSGSSLMTRELTDTRMVDYIMHAPNRFRNLAHAIASHISGTGTAVHAGPITEGRINVRIINGSTNSFASVRVNRQGPWNGTEGSFGINWSRPMSLAVMGSKNQITNNVTRAFLVFGAAGGDNDLPTNGHWVALNWVNPTNAEVLVSKAGVVTTNAATITTSASPLGFGLWIDHKTNGTGDIYYAERNSATSAALQKPTNATVTYSNGPMVISTNQTSLTFGLVGLSTNTGASFEIVGLNNAVFFAP
jgi:hypothetical protein